MEQTTEVGQSLVNGQGREHQGREHQGTSLVGGEIQSWQLSSLRKSFPGEPLTAPADKVFLRQGEVVFQRSLAYGTTASLGACASTSYGLNRACGWASAGIGTCVPGTAVGIGSGGTCGGTCTGDTMVRVCAGSSPCEASSAIASNDDSCGTLCSYATFTCPSSGVYNVLSGSYASGVATTPNLAATAGSFPYVNIEHGGTSLVGANLSAIRPDGTTLVTTFSQIVPELVNSPYVHVGTGHVAGTTYRYNITALDSQFNSVSLCGPDYDNYNVAIPVQGYWQSNGWHVNDAAQATFACKTGVVNKCYRWGYRPWDWSLEGQTWVSGEPLHQACTRMARADYCGDGVSYTQNGTEINLWDSLVPQVQVRDAVAQGMTFEAGWTVYGANCLSHVRWSNAPAYVKQVGCRAPRDQMGNPRECNSQYEAEHFVGAPVPRLFNDSAVHDGGVW